MNTRWLAYGLALAALVVFGYACKGGDGVVYLTVLQESPEDERTDVQVETRIGFQVDAPIDEATLTSDTFFVEDPNGTRVVGELSLDDDDPSITIFNPDGPLDVITTFTATITAELAGRGGATLEEDFTWQFMTLDAEWGISEWVEPSGIGRSAEQQVVVDGQSNAIAVWEFTPELAGSNPPTGIWANRYTRVDLWGVPEQIDAGDGGSRNPALAADDAGNAFAVWEEWSNDGGRLEANIWTNRYVVDQGWGTTERLQDGVLPSLTPSVAADPAGNAIAIWIELEFPSNRQVVRSRRYEPGSGWGTNELIDAVPNTTPPSTTDVQLDDSGNAIALWSERTLTVPEGGSGEVLWANRYVAGEGWETARLIKSDPATRAQNARLSLSANGEAHVVWIQYVDNPGNQTRHDIWSVRYAPGSNWDSTDWTEPERIDNYEIGNKGSPDIAVDGMGVAHAVWWQDDQELQNDFVNIHANRYTAASGWGTPVLVEPPTLDPRDDANASQPRLGVNAAGNTFVVWRQDWENWGSIWSNRIDPGQNWVPTNTVLIENIARPGKSPKIAVDDNRHAHAVWLHAVETSIDRVRTNRFE